MKIINPNELRCGLVPGPKPVVLVSCGKPDSTNIITVSYVGQLSDKLMYIGIRPSRYSNKIIRKEKRFGINYMTANFVREVDYCGLVSGKNVDKFKVTKFTKEQGVLGIPIIKESPLNIECLVREIIRKDEHDIFLGEVKSISRGTSRIDWLFHDGFKYFSNSGFVGRVYCAGKELMRS